MRDYDRVERVLLLGVPVLVFWLLLFLGRHRMTTAELLGWGVGFALLYPPIMYFRTRN